MGPASLTYSEFGVFNPGGVYLAEGIMCASLLNLTTRDSNLSVFIFAEARDALMSFNQSISVYLVNNNFIERVCISHPRHVMRLAIRTSPAILRSERGSYISAVLSTIVV